MIKNRTGFTLVELMIVTAIIGIMALVAAPNIINGLPRYRIKVAARDCTSQLRNARYLAIKQKRDVEVVFNAAENNLEVDGRQFPVSGSFTKQYGSGVAFGRGDGATGISGDSIPADGVAFNDNRFVFTARGFADFGAGTAVGAVYFTNNEGAAYAVSVNAAGAVALLRWRGTEWER